MWNELVVGLQPLGEVFLKMNEKKKKIIKKNVWGFEVVKSPLAYN